MALIAPVLIGVVLFFWFAFCLTVWAWFKTITCLCECKFIRAALWFNVGVFMLFWWFDKPHDWDTMMPGIIVFTSVGALGTLARYYRKRKAMLAIPAWTPADVSGSVIPFVKLQVERKRD